MRLEDSDRAVNLANQLTRLQGEKNIVSYHMGKLGYYARQLGKDFLKANGADTWKSWCAETGNPNYNTLSKYTRLFRIFGEDGLNILDEQWVAIGPHKLEIISKHINDDWYDNTYLLDNAESLSVSDLITVIKGESARNQPDATRGLVPDPVAPGVEGSDLASRLSPVQYKKLVKGSPCCVCGKEGETTYAHWPRTKNRGEFGLPLCGQCHRIQEDTAKTDWFRDHFVNISQWLDKLIGG